MAIISSIKSLTARAIDIGLANRPMDAESETLRCSSIGDPCGRRVWYTFRLATHPTRPEPRIQRIFDNGHARETAIIDMLVNAGMDVQDIDPETDKQWRVALADGVLTGSVDGIVTGVPEAPKTPHLLEIKTMNSKRWQAWRAKGVKKSDPKYYVQIHLYMSALGLKRCLFVAENQDTKEIEAERVEFDGQFALVQEARAERIAASNAPPPRLNENPDWWECKLCPHHGICHSDELPRRSCRTCIAASRTGTDWHCDRHAIQLDFDHQAKGCDLHLYSPGILDRFTVIDVDLEACRVRYRKPDGGEWIDGPSSSEASP